MTEEERLIAIWTNCKAFHESMYDWQRVLEDKWCLATIEDGSKDTPRKHVIDAESVYVIPRGYK